MTAPVLLIAGLVMLALAVIAIVSGKVIAGSRGLKANYYYRQDQPLLYYFFVIFYLLVGLFVIFQAR